MRFRRILFILLLYIALVWVLAAYQYSAPELQHYGLMWTAWGIAAVLSWILVEQVYAIWKNWRASRSQKEPKKTPAQPVLHEDDSGFDKLWEQARETLAASPEYGRQGRQLVLDELPLYFLIGASQSGKTSTFINSGIH